MLKESIKTIMRILYNDMLNIIQDYLDNNR